MLTTQTFLHAKVFGDFLSMTRPLEYRRQEWQELNKGRERSIRLIVRAMLGVPSAHHGEHEHAMWCFAFPEGALLVIWLLRGTVIEMSARNEQQKEIQEAIDFLLSEITTRVKQL